MKPISENKKILDLAFEMFTNLGNDDFEYIYRGNFSPTISTNILSLAEGSLLGTTGQKSLKKRIYFLIVEGLQNVTKHAERDTTPRSGNDIFAIQKTQGKYFITTGNVIRKEDEKILRPKLEQLNLLGKDQLKKLYKEVLTTGQLSKKGGAGLGLIEMARKSGKKLQFNFDEIDEKSSFFYLRTEISREKTEVLSNQSHTKKSLATTIRKFENKLKQENILVSFNGKYNRDTIINILSVIEGQIGVMKTSKKIYNLLVEMLQNISKHTSHLEGDMQGKGVFMLSSKNGNFLLTSGNYILKEEYPKLKQRIDEINNMSRQELDDKYNSVLIDNEHGNDKTTGLGFIDIRLKSKNKIGIFSQLVDEKYFFIVIQAIVET